MRRQYPSKVPAGQEGSRFQFKARVRVQAWSRPKPQRQREGAGRGKGRGRGSSSMKSIRIQDSSTALHSTASTGRYVWTAATMITYMDRSSSTSDAWAIRSNLPNPGCRFSNACCSRVCIVPTIRPCSGLASARPRSWPRQTSGMGNEQLTTSAPSLEPHFCPRSRRQTRVQSPTVPI